MSKPPALTSIMDNIQRGSSTGWLHRGSSWCLWISAARAIPTHGETDKRDRGRKPWPKSTPICVCALLGRIAVDVRGLWPVVLAVRLRVRATFHVLPRDAVTKSRGAC